MFNIGILNVFSRIVKNNVILSRNISVNAPVYLNVTNVLFAEPLKKKKKLDPALIRAKEERKKRKLAKIIRKLEKSSRQLKPIAELLVPMKLKDDLELRKRDLPPPSVEKLEERARILKEWAKFKAKEHKETVQIIDHHITCQEKALTELKKVSEELYLQAIAIDPDLLPFSAKGPVLTPPIENYEPPDGEYIDITRKFEGET